MRAVRASLVRRQHPVPLGLNTRSKPAWSLECGDTLWHNLLRGGVAALVTAAVAVLGTVWHRAWIGVGPINPVPLGLILAFGAIAATIVALRAAWGLAGLLGAAVGAFAATQLVSLTGPGGSVLIQADGLGYAWYLGAPVMVLVVAFSPRSWYRRN